MAEQFSQIKCKGIVINSLRKNTRLLYYNVSLRYGCYEF